MSPVFDSYSAYYDLLYRDKDYAAEAAYVRDLLRRHDRDVRDVLEFGSGTGIHGKLLAGHGFRVTGIELSPRMVARATASEGFTCRQGDIRSVRLGHTFDAVISLFHVMSYQTSNADIQAALSSAAAHLGDRGLFLFDFWYTPAVLAQGAAVRVKRLEDLQYRVTRIAEPVNHPNENLIDVHYTVCVRGLANGEYQEFQEVHPMRHFSLPEIDLFATQAGFERIGTEAFLTGARPGEDTWGVCVVLRKVKP